MPPSAAPSDLTPTGKLRAAINFGNPVLAGRDAAGAPCGISVDLARELARRLGVAIEFVAYDAAGKVVEGLKSKAWDVCFLAIDPLRAADIGFTAAYAVIEGVYLVAEASPVKSNAEIDRAGTRVGVIVASAYDLHLSRELKQATIVRAASSNAVMDLWVAGKLDAVAGVNRSSRRTRGAFPDCACSRAGSWPSTRRWERPATGRLRRAIWATSSRR
jgi:polar amino acid transport system substrate-binding protein